MTMRRTMWTLLPQRPRSRRLARVVNRNREERAVIMASTTEEVVRRHVKCFFEGDLEGVVSDYSADAVLFTPTGPLKGHDSIRDSSAR